MCYSNDGTAEAAAVDKPAAAAVNPPGGSGNQDDIVFEDFARMRLQGLLPLFLIECKACMSASQSAHLVIIVDSIKT